ncbi:hypothetical protein [Levilactobacillus sp. N40-8-2]|uniref:hypothetical protein n=1 Tax=Levilactobacillus muriae TaxID=3238987 RepID=UPI0038B2B94D
MRNRGFLIEAYEAVEKTLQHRINVTPVSQYKSLMHDFTQLYRTKMKLAKLREVTIND